MLAVSVIGGLGVAMNNINDVAEVNAASISLNNYTKIEYLSSLSTGDIVIISDGIYGAVSGTSSDGGASISTSESSWIKYTVTKVTDGFTLRILNKNQYAYAQLVSSTSVNFTHGTTASTFGFSTKQALGTAFQIVGTKGTTFILGYENSKIISGFSSYQFYEASTNNVIGAYIYKQNDSITAKSWATTFLSKTNSPCSNPNNDNYEALNNVWATLKTNYNELSTTAQNALKNNSSSDKTIADALERYQHIINRYTQIEDFIYGREATSASSLNTINGLSNSNTAITIVAIASVIGITTISGIVILRKKRQ